MVIGFGENEIMKESNDDNKSTAMHVGNKASVTKLIAMSLSQEI